MTSKMRTGRRDDKMVKVVGGKVEKWLMRGERGALRGRERAAAAS